MTQSPEEYFASRSWIVVPILEELFVAEVELKALIVGENRYYRMGTNCSPIARSASSYRYNRQSVSVADLYIMVNKDEFNKNGGDFSDLIPSFVRHEAVEQHIFALLSYEAWKNGQDYNSMEIITRAHLMGLEAQYRFAFTNGQSEKLLEFMEKTLPLRLPENRSILVVRENKSMFEKIGK